MWWRRKRRTQLCSFVVAFGKETHQSSIVRFMSASRDPYVIGFSLSCKFTIFYPFQMWISSQQNGAKKIFNVLCSMSLVAKMCLLNINKRRLAFEVANEWKNARKSGDCNFFLRILWIKKNVNYIPCLVYANKGTKIHTNLIYYLPLCRNEHKCIRKKAKIHVRDSYAVSMEMGTNPHPENTARRDCLIYWIAWQAKL